MYIEILTFFVQFRKDLAVSERENRQVSNIDIPYLILTLSSFATTVPRLSALTPETEEIIYLFHVPGPVKRYSYLANICHISIVGNNG